MTQMSGPVSKRPFTVASWRYVIGNEPGIKEDNDGSAYDLQLSTNSDEAIIGSATQDSITVVGGGLHVIPAAELEPIEIPPAINGPRTDLIAVRMDPQWSVVPDGVDPLTFLGPCRLYRIAGTEGSGLPPYDGGPPGLEDEVLYEITRTPGTALSSNGTTVVDRRIRTGPNLYLERTDAPFPAAPLGTRARRGYGPNARSYVRVLDDSGVPTWHEELPPKDVGVFTPNASYSGLSTQEPLGVYRQAGRAGLTGAVYQADPRALSYIAGATYTLGSFPSAFAPAAGALNFPAHFKNTYATIQVVPGPVGTHLVQIIPTITISDRPRGEIVTHLSHISWVAK